MKKLLIIFCTLIASICVSQGYNKYNKRFERLYIENTEEGPISVFQVFHDRESGVEFICATDKSPTSWPTTCFLTGRKWKEK